MRRNQRWKLGRLPKPLAKAMAAIEADLRLAVPANRNQESDARGWCPGIKPGEVIASALNPVLREACGDCH